MLRNYMGKVFEWSCREAYTRHRETWGLPGAVKWARLEGKDRNRRPIEVDIVARLDDGRILTGEVKWPSKPVDAAVHTDLMRVLEDFPASGQGWAKDALAATKSAGYIYFSATGFTEDFTSRASEDARIRLITLDAMYDRRQSDVITAERLRPPFPIGE